MLEDESAAIIVTGSDRRETTTRRRRSSRDDRTFEFRAVSPFFKVPRRDTDRIARRVRYVCTVCIAYAGTRCLFVHVARAVQLVYHLLRYACIARRVTSRTNSLRHRSTLLESGGSYVPLPDRVQPRQISAERERERRGMLLFDLPKKSSAEK